MRVALALLLAAATVATAQFDTVARCGDEPGHRLTIDKTAVSFDWTTRTALLETRDMFVNSLASFSTDNFDGLSSSNVHSFGLGLGTAEYFGFDSDSDFSRGASAPIASMTQNTVTITFSQPQQAVGMFLVGIDNWRGTMTTITCANGDTDTYVYDDDMPGSIADTAYFSTVREPTNTGDWCVSIEITKTSSADFVAIDDLTVGTCVASNERFSCDCTSARAAPGGRTAVIAFGVDGTPCDDVILPSRTIAGRVRDAVTGAELSGVTLELSTTGATTTGSPYSFTDIAPGTTVTVTASADGYSMGTVTLTVNNNVGVDSGAADISMSPILDLTNDWRIVLTWGESPSDLDSHLVTPACQVAFSNPVCGLTGGGQADLDQDDRSSFGPETITITGAADGEAYEYWIYRWSSSGNSLADSGARVQVFQGGSMTAVLDINVPAGGTDRWWHVLRIEGSTLTVEPNALTSSGTPDPSP